MRRTLLTLIVAWLMAPGKGTPPAAAPELVAVTGSVAVMSRNAPAMDSSGVVVWLEPETASATARPAVQPLRTRPRVAQRGKQFEPHLLVVTVGTVVEFPNFDPFFHNVFSLFDGKRFDLGLYEAGSSRSVTFTRAGVCYVFCNIHPEMSAVIVAVDTPHYAVSDRAGAFTIAGVPAGRYSATAWHERHKLDPASALPREVQIAPPQSSLGPIRFTESTQMVVAHKNKYGQDYVPAQPGATIYIK